MNKTKLLSYKKGSEVSLTDYLLCSLHNSVDSDLSVFKQGCHQKSPCASYFRIMYGINPLKLNYFSVISVISICSNCGIQNCDNPLALDSYFGLRIFL